MKSSKNIVFLGMMGSGKTSIGFLISRKLKLDFFDIDNHIEKNFGMKISKIFKDKGEKFFREYEEKITLNILKKKEIVVALGGGAFLNKNIRNEVLKNHFSFWLKLDNDILIKRIKNSAKRPLAYNISYIELENMIKERSKIYSKALYKINCNNLNKTEIIDKIINIYETN
jgi:shikimate kinase/shikimate kinase/3-dehydroquinate synthase